jgi:nitroreductase
VFAFARRLKLRLQWTGWLQYIPTAVLALLFLIPAAVLQFLAISAVAWPLTGVGLFLLALLIFDICTVKLHLHPPERIPRRKDDVGVFDLMRNRRSCRSFQARQLTLADHAELMESVRVQSESPSFSGLDAPSIRFEYVAAPLTVWPVVGAREFLVAIAPRQYSRLAVIDVGRRLQKIVIDATRMGLATCWIGPGADQSTIANVSGVRFDSEKDHIICVCAVGYASWYKPALIRVAQLFQHRRLPLDSLFFADSHFSEPLKVRDDPFGAFGRTYEACRWSPSSFNAQTTRCVAVVDRRGVTSVHDGVLEPKLERFDFYSTTESRYYAAVAVGIWCANWEMGCHALGIPGRFRVLSKAARGVDGASSGHHLPRYDASWSPGKCPNAAELERSASLSSRAS